MYTGPPHSPLRTSRPAKTGESLIPDQRSRPAIIMRKLHPQNYARGSTKSARPSLPISKRPRRLLQAHQRSSRSIAPSPPVPTPQTPVRPSISLRRESARNFREFGIFPSNKDFGLDNARHSEARRLRGNFIESVELWLLIGTLAYHFFEQKQTSIPIL